MTIDELIEKFSKLKEQGLSGDLDVKWESPKAGGGATLCSIEEVRPFCEWREIDGAHDWDEANEWREATFVLVW